MGIITLNIGAVAPDSKAGLRRFIPVFRGIRR